ncbi:hypothetical protein Y032_0090g2330 [Ancylostoma ceylanicum]|uniref:Uncharacterized protein n=1 Tax=Ancylostoma ceylanicum TaxID=53326 RepID=A0A016TMR3_9BILA|nr:hypothetical protein Y032_0090g2330 [Ancylostoma ceylanicum]
MNISAAVGESSWRVPADTRTRTDGAERGCSATSDNQSTVDIAPPLSLPTCSIIYKCIFSATASCHFMASQVT